MRFARHKKVRTADPLTDAAARRITTNLIAFREVIICVLQRWEQRLTNSQKKVLLVVCCLTCCIYCGYILEHALFSRTAAAVLRYEPVQPVAQPPPFYRRKDSVKGASKPNADTNFIHAFKSNK